MKGVRGRSGWLYGSALLLLVATLLASAALYQQRVSASPAHGATIALIAPSQARPGSLITVDLVVSNAQNLAGYQATVQYDPAQLRLVGASIAEDLRGSGRDLLPLGPTEHAHAVALGAVTCPARSCSDSRPAQAPRILRGINGRAKLGSVRFYAATPGSYPLTLTDVRLVDPQGLFLPATAASITLHVIAP